MEHKKLMGVLIYFKTGSLPKKKYFS